MNRDCPYNIALQRTCACEAEPGVRHRSLMFAIKSSTSRRKYLFSNLIGEGFSFEVDGDIYGAVDVSMYMDPEGLRKMFESCAACAKPWKGSKSWAAIDGNFDISMSCSSVGVVQIVVNLGNAGTAEEWSIQASLQTEFGQLERIGRDAQDFFGASDA